MGFYHDASLGLAFESASIVQLNTATEMKKGSHIQCYVTPCREASCASHKGDARDTNTRQSPRPFDPTERYRC